MQDTLCCVLSCFALYCVFLMKRCDQIRRVSHSYFLPGVLAAVVGIVSKKAYVPWNSAISFFAVFEPVLTINSAATKDAAQLQILNTLHDQLKMNKTVPFSQSLSNG